MSKESRDYAKKSAEFKRWLALYFIQKGYYKITDKAIEEFGHDTTPRQTMEFAEIYSDRERQERSEYRVGLTAKEKKKIAHMKIADMIEQGKTGELYDNGYITNGKLSWKDKNLRIVVVRKLVEILDKDQRELTQKDFYENRLVGLLNHYYNSSPYKAVKEVFHELNIKPWEITRTLRGFFDKKENRVVAVKWLVEKLKKDPRDLTGEDFYENRLVGLLNHYYNSSPYEAVKETFPELDIKAWEMVKTPNGFYNIKENGVAAVKWLVEKLKKDPRDLTGEDFYENRLGGLSVYYNGSPYKAVKEAFPEMNIKPWEMAITLMGFYKKKENRIEAVKWLVEKTGKDPRNLTQNDFKKNRLRGLLPFYNYSPYEALKEAGLVTEADESYMRQKGIYRHSTVPSSKEAREAAKKLERKAGKKQPVKGKRRLT